MSHMERVVPHVFLLLENAGEHSSAVWSDLKLEGTVKEEFKGSFGNGRTTQHARF